MSPFWTNASQELSRKSWLPTEIASHELDSTSWNTSSQGQDQFSQSLRIRLATDASENSGMTSWQLSPTSLPGTTEGGTTKTAKIRIHPTPAQADLLQQCAGTHRYFWNKAKAFVDTEYDRCRQERIAELEAGRLDGCAHRGADQKCMAMTENKKGKMVACKKKPLADGFGCKDHPPAQGCAQPPPANCGAAVNQEAAIGCPSRYFCDSHAGKGLGVQATYEGHSIWSAITIRGAVMKSDKDLPDDEAWQKDIPFDTRQGAIRKFVAALSSFFERKKAHPETEMPGFLSKKSQRDSVFAVNKKAVTFQGNQLRVFPSRLTSVIRVAHKDKKRLRKHLEAPDTEACDAEIVRTYTGKWYILLPRKAPSKEPEPMWASQAYNSVFLDPGGRTFQTFYSPDGVAGKLGDDFYKGRRMEATLHRADKLMGKAAKLANQTGEGRRRRRIIIRAQALRTKVRDTVRDLHRKACHFLCANFKHIFIPKFQAQKMTQVGRRVLGSSAVRNLTTFAHSEFRNKLLEYGARRACTVTLVSEAFTTSTCTACGELMDVGSKKVVSCNACGCRLDRDLAGARNIFIRLASVV